MSGARTGFWDAFDRLAPVPVYFPGEYRRACRRNAFLFDVMQVLILPDRHTIDAGANRGVLSWFCAKHSSDLSALEAI